MLDWSRQPRPQQVFHQHLLLSESVRPCRVGVHKPHLLIRHAPNLPTYHDWASPAMIAYETGQVTPRVN